jgi:hypothetical protein
MKDAGVPALYVKSFHGEYTGRLLPPPVLTTGWGGDEMGIREVFQRARAEAPCVLVMEDLDSLINDNNRSFFLNEVDGLEDNDGLLLVIAIVILTASSSDTRLAPRTTLTASTRLCPAGPRDSTASSEPLQD